MKQVHCVHVCMFACLVVGCDGGCPHLWWGEALWVEGLKPLHGLHKNGGCPHACMVAMQPQLLILSEGFPHKGYVYISVCTCIQDGTHACICPVTNTLFPSVVMFLARWQGSKITRLLQNEVVVSQDIQRGSEPVSACPGF